LFGFGQAKIGHDGLVLGFRQFTRTTPATSLNYTQFKSVENLPKNNHNQENKTYLKRIVENY